MKNRILLLLFFSLMIFVFLDCKNSSPKKTATPTAKPTLTSEQETMYLDKGKQAAGATFVALSQELQKAVKEGGVPNAIQYCNVAAYPVTDSLSKVHNAVIRRTSLKNRNPKNAPTALEKEVLQDFATKVAAGKMLKPTVKLLDNQKIAFFAPIMLNDFCLKCHGKIGETLAETDYQIIQQHYPDDKATGYMAGDLRGMWSIEFKLK